MSILAVVLFGSRARGDHTAGSDTDLLFATSEESGRHVTNGSVSFSYYAMEDLCRRARSGDLFLCHVLREGRTLYDPDARIDELRGLFRLRSSYTPEIRRAADLGWLLARVGSTWWDRRLAARRMAWCVRTILIARAAEAGEPRFSLEALAAGSPEPSLVRRLVEGRDRDATENSAEELAQFLSALRLAEPCAQTAEPAAYHALFKRTHNDIGLAFLRRPARSEPYA
jgi:hypothetical protein